MPYLVLVEPDDVAPVEPLVPELLDVPAEPLVDGIVVVELPDEPMPELVPELDAPPVPIELLPEGMVLLELPPAPMPDVEPDVDEPEVDEPLLMPLPVAGAVADDLDDEGAAEPLADPPAAPMPEAEPLAEPDIDGPELQAARAALQAMARINLFIRNS